MTDGGEVRERDTQWHPAFCSAIRLEFRNDRDKLTFVTEHSLSSKPLTMDMLIVLKQPGAKLENPLGNIFRGFNIFEFKSPGDHMGVKAYYELMSYAYRLMMIGFDGRDVERDNLTLSLLRREKPEALICSLESSGMTISPQGGGIYRVEGHMYFPLQIIVTKEMSAEAHLWLSSLRRGITREAKIALLRAIDEIMLRGEQEQLNDADALLSVICAENKDIMSRNEEGIKMSEYLFNLAMEMNRDKFAAIRAESEALGERRGERRGEKFGGLKMLFRLVSDGALPLETAVSSAGMSADEFIAGMKAWLKSSKI